MLSEMVDVIILRTATRRSCETFRALSRVPVINAMTSQTHPCQLLADMQTFHELPRAIRGRRWRS